MLYSSQELDDPMYPMYILYIQYREEGKLQLHMYEYHTYKDTQMQTQRYYVTQENKNLYMQLESVVTHTYTHSERVSTCLFIPMN